MGDAAEKKSGLALQPCKAHGKGELWIVCVHATPENAVGRRVDDDWVSGEVLCAECAKAPQAAHDHLRTACGSCVREKFKIEGAN